MIVREKSAKHNTREEIYEEANYLRQKIGIQRARLVAREMATHRTISGRDFWFAVTEILGGDTRGWRQ